MLRLSMILFVHDTFLSLGLLEKLKGGSVSVAFTLNFAEMCVSLLDDIIRTNNINIDKRNLSLN